MSGTLTVTFYDLLGVSKDATPDDLRRAYRQAALRLHPDKAGDTPEAQERFTRMKAAYDVLNDPYKRKIYDQYGEEGVKMAEDFRNISPNAMFTALVQAGWKARLFLATLIFLIFCGPLLLFIFISLEADGTVNWKWRNALIPLWFMNIYYLLNQLMPYDDPLDKLLRLSKISSFVVFEIFLCMRMDDQTDWSYAVVFIPAYFMAVLRIYTYGISPKPVSVEEGQPPMEPPKVETTRYGYFSLVLDLIFVILLALRLDDTITWHWGAVFTPIWIQIFYNTMVEFTPAVPSASEGKEAEQKSASLVSRLFVLCFIGTPFLLMVLKLDTDADFSVFYVFIPVFIFLGCSVCCLCMAVCCAENFSGDPNDFDAQYGTFSADQQRNYSASNVNIPPSRYSDNEPLLAEENNV
eukprot:TRINITY_DN15643_c0_g1::TRINITY_DN15643_c0_g1_i1::g.18771::m.18771 TRINITY_DN15643_c0_g1::TRINITY_DN15643_c0_g1_i1::g.18771  ORF type:complete len:408 (-),score=69.36,sp/P56101/DNJC5_TETCF/39.45/1e-18,DnaJ/PF00226.26/1.1e-22,Tmemb_185A/PF10269.4/0.014,Tmemb_185A/PF10269.4/8.5e-15,Tmemb_185A/PF10269.4/0.00037,DUF1516/PF07457.6/0.2,Frag1/PF10277.4/3.4e+03,Frag1/PF10277.4/1.9e+03,Frag1/PF10277.4/0.063 TRINITY_DN15643_c0_g1_i1:1266-2489(-)